MLKTASLGVSHLGSEAATAHFTRRVKLYEDGTPRTKHVTTNHLIEIDESAAVVCRRDFRVGLNRLAPNAIERADHADRDGGVAALRDPRGRSHGGRRRRDEDPRVSGTGPTGAVATAAPGGSLH